MNKNRGGREQGVGRGWVLSIELRMLKKNVEVDTEGSLLLIYRAFISLLPGLAKCQFQCGPLVQNRPSETLFCWFFLSPIFLRTLISILLLDKCPMCLNSTSPVYYYFNDFVALFLLDQFVLKSLFYCRFPLFQPPVFQIKLL